MRRSAMMRAVLAVVAVAVAGVPASNASSPVSAAPGDDLDLDVPDDVANSIADSKVEQTYIVTMRAEPAVTYEGGTAGIPATAPDKGDKLATDSANVVRYRAVLKNSHDQVLDRAGVARSTKIYDYSVATNGFAARINGRQGAALRSQPGVESVQPARIERPDTITTPRFLGLSTRGGAWSKGHRGEDLVVGVIDSGIWPESRSFSDANDTTGVFDELEEWNGTCQSGEDFSSQDCNNKLIGARFYPAGFGGGAAIKRDFPYEFISPRDADGHGSHTASTAAGRGGVPVRISGQSFGRASGMAPDARVSAYKVCWGRGSEGGCNTSDSVAAIDQAVADGVDAINYSISGSSTNFVDPVEVAFLRASNAGIFVAASAGNSGPDASTVAHPSPWITTVAASTHDRYSEATLTTREGVEYVGASSQSTGLPLTRMIYAGDIPAAGATAADAARCSPGSIDPALAIERFVVCDRGVNARTEKSLVVRDAGGVGMVLVNTTPNSVNGDIHFVPTIHLDADVRPALLAYVSGTRRPASSLSPGVSVGDENAPEPAVFSSRGPLRASSDLLKPDITAPGVDVLAAVSPDGYFGRNYDLLSGTSMSSPHMAGLSLVVKSARPNWTPAETKSALMTSAYAVDGASPFDVGSGHVSINRAIASPLVYPAGVNDYFGFLCGLGEIDNPALCADNDIEVSDLNQPNIAVGQLAGTRTVTRRIKNSGTTTATFRSTVAAPPGLDVAVAPSQLRLNPGQTKTFRVTFTANSGAVFDEYTFGKLTWKAPTISKAESELVVRPVAISAPTEVTGTGVSGADEFDVTFGYDGPYAAGAHGMIPATKNDITVTDDPGNDIDGALACYYAPSGGTEEECGIKLVPFTVPAGTALTRVSTFDAFTDGNDDVDLYIFNPAGVNVGASGGGTAQEQVDIPTPQAGQWLAIVHGWETDGDHANLTMFNWSVPADPAVDNGSLKIESASDSAAVGETATIKYSWTGLAADNKYLGAVSHNRGTEVLRLTTVAIDAYGGGG
ncbi:MAG: S8 family serine peptidase [Actinomycetota bacterium]|nr:S8 family serine peptidase [Actinomycetota bacterium]